MKAAEIRKAMRHPVPWVVTAPRATPVPRLSRDMPAWSAAPMRFAAKVAVRRRG